MLEVILHEEHIELLTEDFKELKKVAEGKVLQEGTLHFTGKRQSLRCSAYRFSLELQNYDLFQFKML